MTKMRLVKPEPAVAPPNITDVYNLVVEFNTVYGVMPSERTQQLYTALIEEEHEEWIEEFYSATPDARKELKELADLLYVTLGLVHASGYNLQRIKPFKILEYYDYSITDCVSEIATKRVDKEILNDLIYAIYGYAEIMGWNLVEAFKRVHKSNMSKLGTDGAPIRREDGKVLKGPNYTLPNLEDLV